LCITVRMKSWRRGVKAGHGAVHGAGKGSMHKIPQYDVVLAKWCMRPWLRGTPRVWVVSVGFGSACPRAAGGREGKGRTGGLAGHDVRRHRRRPVVVRCDQDLSQRLSISVAILDSVREQRFGRAGGEQAGRDMIGFSISVRTGPAPAGRQQNSQFGDSSLSLRHVCIVGAICETFS
jgi:hypothetical protein